MRQPGMILDVAFWLFKQVNRNLELNYCTGAMKYCFHWLEILELLIADRAKNSILYWSSVKWSITGQLLLGAHCCFFFLSWARVAHYFEMKDARLTLASIHCHYARITQLDIDTIIQEL